MTRTMYGTPEYSVSVRFGLFGDSRKSGTATLIRRIGSKTKVLGRHRVRGYDKEACRRAAQEWAEPIAARDRRTLAQARLDMLAPTA